MVSVLCFRIRLHSARGWTAHIRFSPLPPACNAPLQNNAVRWVCQQQPSEAHVPGLAAAKLDIEYVVAPKQEDLPLLYKGHDAFLFSSRLVGLGGGALLVGGVCLVVFGCCCPFG